MPQALEQAFEDNVDMRRSLPVGYGRYMGVAHCEKNGVEGGAEAGVGGGSGSKSSISSADALDYTLTSPESIPAQREAFIEKAVGLFQNMMFSLNFDRAADDALWRARGVLRQVHRCGPALWRDESVAAIRERTRPRRQGGERRGGEQPARKGDGGGGERRGTAALGQRAEQRRHLARGKVSVG